MARVGKGLYAPSGKRRTYRVYQVYDVFPCVYACWRGCRILTCLHGTQFPSGVQVPPKLSVKVKRGTWEPRPFALCNAGQALP
jgi:hypothetical protein